MLKTCLRHTPLANVLEMPWGMANTDPPKGNKTAVGEGVGLWNFRFINKKKKISSHITVISSSKSAWFLSLSKPKHACEPSKLSSLLVSTSVETKKRGVQVLSNLVLQLLNQLDKIMHITWMWKKNCPHKKVREQGKDQRGSILPQSKIYWNRPGSRSRVFTSP